MSHTFDLLDGIIANVRKMVEDVPDVTGAEVLDALVLGRAHAVLMIAAMQEVAVCRSCGKPISRASEGAAWKHADEWSSVGCRAASRSDGDWDDSLDRHWKARPRAGSIMPTSQGRRT